MAWLLAFAAGLRLRSTACSGDPCNANSNPDAVAVCNTELASLQQQQTACVGETQVVSAEGAAAKEALRQAWQAANATAYARQAEVDALEAELAAVNAENDALHAQVVARLQTLGLVQTNPNSTDSATEWLDCMNEKDSVQLKVSACQSALVAMRARHSAQQSHYEGLRASAQQNVDMVESRLSILTQMLVSAEARREKLTQQVAELADMSVSFVSTSSRTSASVARQPTVDDMRQQLAEMDVKIAGQERTVEARKQATEAAHDAMSAFGMTQKRVATEYNGLRTETMAAFKKAFELDYKLEQAEAMHDEAYITVKNATAAYQTAAKAEHAAMQALQDLVAEKRRLEHAVTTAEDGEVDPDWARAPEEKHARPSAAAVLACVLFA